MSLEKGKLKRLRISPNLQLVFFIFLAMVTGTVAYYLFFNQPDRLQFSPEMVAEIKRETNIEAVASKLTYCFNEEERRSLRLVASPTVSNRSEDTGFSGSSRQASLNQIRETTLRPEMGGLPGPAQSSFQVVPPESSPVGFEAGRAEPSRGKKIETTTAPTRVVIPGQGHYAESSKLSLNTTTEPSRTAEDQPGRENPPVDPLARENRSADLTAAEPSPDNIKQGSPGDDSAILPEPFHPEDRNYDALVKAGQKAGQPVARPEDKEETIWVINTLSTQELEKVQKVFTSLPKKDFAVYAYKTNINGKDWFRIRIGFFTSRQEAEEVGERLAKQYSLPQPWVVRPGPQELATYYTR